VSGAARHWLTSLAGAIAGMMLWAVNMQLGQILPYMECGSRFSPEVLISFAAACATLACGWVSWSAGTRSGCPNRAADHTGRFAARVSALLGFVFAFTLLLQAASTLVLTGCER
jgi:hypothetical protein